MAIRAEQGKAFNVNKLIERIDRWARLAPDRAAHVTGERVLTYGDLARRSDRLAAYLGAALPRDRGPVAVLGHKEPEMLVAFLGAVKSGHPYIPIDTSIPAHRVERIVTTAGASLTLTPDQVAAVVAEQPVAPEAGPRREPDPDDPWYIIFTSGSTGDPKGVVITARCLESFVDWMLGEHNFAGGGEVFLNQAPFSFDLSVMDLYLSLATGGTLSSITRDEIANPRQLYRSLAASGVTTWVSTPSFAQMCLVERTFEAALLPRVRRFLFCGETLPEEVASELLDRFPAAEVWNTYGPTETTVATTSVLIDREMLKCYSPLPVGRPKPDSRILVVDDAGQPVAAGERGEIVIAGPNVSPGYLGRPDLTAAAFFELDGMQAYRTGDRGHFQDELLFFDGRRDNQIKLHGHRIELGDIEANLRALDGVRDAVVIPVSKGGRPDSLAAFVALAGVSGRSDFEVTRALRAQLAGRVPSYMVPRKFHFLAALPMTANGKADRRRLAEMLD